MSEQEIENNDKRVDPKDRVDDSTRRQNRQDNVNTQGSVLRGGIYSDIGKPYATERNLNSPTGWRS